MHVRRHAAAYIVPSQAYSAIKLITALSVDAGGHMSLNMLYRRLISMCHGVKCGVNTRCECGGCGWSLRALARGDTIFMNLELLMRSVVTGTRPD